jgi:hypothetical protein
MSKPSKTDWERLAKLDDADIDTNDIPELDDDFFRRAELRVPVKQAVTIRLMPMWLSGSRGRARAIRHASISFFANTCRPSRASGDEHINAMKRATERPPVVINSVTCVRSSPITSNAIA